MPARVARVAPAPVSAFLPELQSALSRSLDAADVAIEQRGAAVTLSGVIREVSAALETEATVAEGETAAATPAAPRSLELPEDDESATDSWSLQAWLKGAGVHRVAAAVIQRATGPEHEGGALGYLRSLGRREELMRLFRSDDFVEGVVDLLWPQVENLKRAGAATSDELQSKFAGSIELSYSGLDTFFRGLEGVVGSPAPMLMGAMATEHTTCGDSTGVFVTGNYGVETTSKIEWFFVANGTATPEEAGVTRWPVEAEAKLPERSRCRSRRPTDDLLKGAERTKRDELLRAANQPALVDEEVIAARLYTGPMFVKYNGVLRGLRSESDFLRNSMITLCCPKAVADGYVAKSIGFEAATQSLNKYTTTLHGINSAIIKLGKLTVATKVYRGIAGMALPAEFWRPNDYGVRGGVEGAFMSTTLQREVAMGYAAGGASSKMGIVIEVQQGMVNRGADISWLSQYPHEQEILFGPLTGMEVLNTRTDGSVVVIECAFSINLTALTLEQVLSKRRKVVADMCGQLVIKAKAKAEAEEWHVLRRGDDDKRAVPLAVERYLDERLMALAQKEPSHYNENKPLGAAIQEAVATADILDGWPEGLQELAKVARVEQEGEEGEGGEPVGDVTVKMLVQSEGPLFLTTTIERHQRVPMKPIHGLCALFWARPESAPITLDLSERNIGADGLAALARAMAPTLTSLKLARTDCANNGGDTSGIQQLCAALETRNSLVELDLSGNSLNSQAANQLSIALSANFMAVLTSIDVGYNKIGKEQALNLVSIFKEKDQMKSVGLANCDLGVDGAQAVADYVSGSAVLKNLSLNHNSGISGEVAQQLAEAVLASKSLEVFSEVPIKELREDKLTELNLSSKGLGPAEVIVIAKLVAVTAVLKKLELRSNSIKVEGAIAIGESLKTNTTLEELNLYNNDFGPAGGKAIGEALQLGIAVLTDLSLGANDIVAEGAKAIAKALGSGKAVLKSLWLQSNNIGTEGAKALADALASGKAVLTSLNLELNDIGNDGAIAIADALKSGTAVLTKLDLQYNSLDDDAKRALTDAKRGAALELLL